MAAVTRAGERAWTPRSCLACRMCGDPRIIGLTSRLGMPGLGTQDGNKVTVDNEIVGTVLYDRVIIFQT